ncbi:MAG: response regulator [Myxococcota bacterium]|jgi:CheY-like chemotaxis protein|nr:response regulator [Myxococcota bacterium]
MNQADNTIENNQRTLEFLKGLKAKLPQIERDIGRLETAARFADLYRGHWPTESLERVVRPLTTVDAEYDLDSIAAWGRQVAARLESVHRRMEAPTAEDFDWLRTRLRELSSLCEEEWNEIESSPSSNVTAPRRTLSSPTVRGMRTSGGMLPTSVSIEPRSPLSTLPPGTNVDELLDPLTQHMVSDEDIAQLYGRSALVADDDADVRALFEKTLGKVGMKVRCVDDGQAALEALHENPPDVLITDIVMPRLDGWELLARLRRDFTARHIPTIILSWKEDLLERVRDLKAGASGYMLKEADRKQILYTVARALLPRLTLERRLTAEEDVIGRVERVGVLPLLATTMLLRPSCRVHITEHWNFYEVHLTGGEIVAVTRTATDGSFSSGPRALERLVGVAAGRFAVVDPSPTTPKRQLEGNAWATVKMAAERLSGMVTRLVDAGIAGNAIVVLDEEEAAAYGRILPPSLGALLNKLRAGQTLRSIFTESETAPDVLETLLVDLVRAGVVIDVKLVGEASIPPPPVESVVESVPAAPPAVRHSEPPMPLSDDELAELATPIVRYQSLPPVPKGLTDPRIVALEHKKRLYRGATLVLGVLCLSLSAALAISVYQSIALRPAAHPKVIAPVAARFVSPATAAVIAPSPASGGAIETPPKAAPTAQVRPVEETPEVAPPEPTPESSLEAPGSAPNQSSVYKKKKRPRRQASARTEVNQR